jgi:hypothetical protein
LFGHFQMCNGHAWLDQFPLMILPLQKYHLALIHSLVVEYCDSKSDQKGERTSPKNCCANPFDYNVCIFTAHGCYFCIHNESWKLQKGTLGTQSREVQHIDIVIRYLKYTDLIKKKLKSM